MSLDELKIKATEIRKLILKSTTAAGTGHPTSSLSATDLMTVLMFNNFFKTDLDNTHNKQNDRLIFSKGHASPLFYSLYTALGKINEDELMTLRKFDSRLEGHPTLKFPYTEVASGSLGQGLGVGVGYAIVSKMQSGNWPTNKSEILSTDREIPTEVVSAHTLREFNTFVLLGDSEFAEGSVYEALELGTYYKLNNLIAILDVNRLGQRGQTMTGWETDKIAKKTEAFGWETIQIDGHNLSEITEAYSKLLTSTSDKPKMLVAKTIKGKGVSFLENKEGWHGKTLNSEQLEQALLELNQI